MNFNVIKRILVIKLRHIGDVLLTVPVFRALRESFPDAYITALINSGTGEVLEGNSLIDEILYLDRGMKQLSPVKHYLREIDFLRRVRKKGFNMTVELTGGDRAAIVSFASGARYRIGWKTKKGFIGKKHLYTHLSKPDGRRHMVLQNLDVVNQFGISTENLSVDIHIPENDRLFIKKLLEENNPSLPLLTERGAGGLRNIIIHVHPTSRWLFKCWKDEYMAEIIRWLLDNTATVIVTSSPDKKEMDKAKRILSLVASRFTLHTSRLLDLCGKTTIKQLAAISDISDMFFGVDSAPMHIAAAVGTPVIALFGPSGSYNWGPWNNDQKPEVRSQKSEEIPYQKRNGIQTSGMHTVIQRDWDCIPCGKDGCNSTKISKCIEDIKPGEIKAILEEKLKRSAI
jgi:heptosyltransferase-3